MLALGDETKNIPICSECSKTNFCCSSFVPRFNPCPTGLKVDFVSVEIVCCL